MRELSLSVLDIAQNAIAADASLIDIRIDEDSRADTLAISIADNGRGMDADLVRRVGDPFVTTRTTRSVGLGIPLFKAGALASGGHLRIDSKPGAGTSVQASYRLGHIDRPPLGDIAGTILALILARPDIDFTYEHRVDDRSYHLDTRELRETLQGVPLDTPEVAAWIREHLEQGIDALNGGA